MDTKNNGTKNITCIPRNECSLAILDITKYAKTREKYVVTATEEKPPFKSLTYRCQPNFKFNNNQKETITRYCQDDNTWSGREPECVVTPGYEYENILMQIVISVAVMSFLTLGADFTYRVGMKRRRRKEQHNHLLESQAHDGITFPTKAMQSRTELGVKDLMDDMENVYRIRPFPSTPEVFLSLRELQCIYGSQFGHDPIKMRELINRKHTHCPGMEPPFSPVALTLSGTSLTNPGGSKANIGMQDDSEPWSAHHSPRSPRHIISNKNKSVANIFAAIKAGGKKHHS